MAEADGVYVLDTGSTGRDRGAPAWPGGGGCGREGGAWRFDTARNRSLELVPEDADICVCTDLDEVFHPGWRAALEAGLDGTGPTQAVYRYTWNFNAERLRGHRVLD